MGALRTLRNGVVKGLEWLVAAMVALLTVDVLWGVFTRFCLGAQATFTDELACVLLVWISMVGAALCFDRKMHLGVDFFTGLMRERPRKADAAVVLIVTFALSAIVFVVGGWKLALSQMTQELPTMRWLSRGQVYLALPIAGVFICLFSLEHLVAALKSGPEEGGKSGEEK